MIAAVTLMVALVVFRLLPVLGGGGVAAVLANYTPLVAVAFCAGAVLPRRLGAGLVLGLFLLTDAVLNLHYGKPLLNAYSAVMLATFALVFVAGSAVRPHARKLSWLLGGTAAGALGFYLVTNTASFFFDPAYTKTAAGWVQALTTGVPGFPPTYLFFLKSVAGNLLFAGLFWLVVVRPGHAGAKEAAPDRPAQPRRGTPHAGTAAR